MVVVNRFIHIDINCANQVRCFFEFFTGFLKYYVRSLFFAVLLLVFLTIPPRHTGLNLILVLIISPMMLSLEEYLHFFMMKKNAKSKFVTLRLHSIFVVKKVLLGIYRIEVITPPHVYLTPRILIVPPAVILIIGFIFLISGKTIGNCYSVTAGLFCVSQGLFALIPVKFLKMTVIML